MGEDEAGEEAIVEHEMELMGMHKCPICRVEYILKRYALCSECWELAEVTYGSRVYNVQHALELLAFKDTFDPAVKVECE